MLDDSQWCCQGEVHPHHAEARCGSYLCFGFVLALTAGAHAFEFRSLPDFVRGSV